MKKIIATVLAMVMALALCTVAFADTQKYDAYDAETGHADYVAKYLKYNKGDTNSTPKKIAFYQFYEDEALTQPIANAKFVAVTKAADADYVLKYNGKDTVAMYLAIIADETYDGDGTAYTNIGKKCGQYKLAAGETSDTKFYTAVNNDTDKTELFKAVTGGNTKLLVDGKVIACAKIGVLSEVVVQHVWVLDQTKMVAKCSECGATAKLYEKYAEVPAGADYVQIQGLFLVADATATKPADGKTDSPKTFDAGIAMYVGMALTSVAGSAVVIGKKKEF